MAAPSPGLAPPPCSDPKGKHKVISRTEAKKRFALRDEDLDHRRPVLRFLSKKNPHNPRYGDMKLYLLSQVEERACSLHGSVANIELLKEERREKREQTANKRFENRIKAIRKQVSEGIPAGQAQHSSGPTWKSRRLPSTSTSSAPSSRAPAPTPSGRSASAVATRTSTKNCKARVCFPIHL